MARIETDERGWPWVLVIWPQQPVTDEDLEVFLDATHGQLMRGRHVALHLSDRGSGLGSKHRRRMADWVRDNSWLLKDRVLGGAIVVKSPVIRGMITAINWLTPPPFPQRLFSEKAEAETWLAAQLEAAGISAPRLKRAR